MAVHVADAPVLTIRGELKRVVVAKLSTHESNHGVVVNGQATRQEQSDRAPVRGDEGGMAVVELFHLVPLNDRRHERSIGITQVPTRDLLDDLHVLQVAVLYPHSGREDHALHELYLVLVQLLEPQEYVAHSTPPGTVEEVFDHDFLPSPDTGKAIALQVDLMPRVVAVELDRVDFETVDDWLLIHDTTI